MMSEPMPKRYRHYKGGIYEFVCEANGPHGALDYQTPAEFAGRFRNTIPGSVETENG
ncbi:hypothetical protein GALL_83170 [mine drainage metagenome]|uniref:DUF1653 domain-containing protein n=1 Tax=mine drainage metagenome TaxID=410659 RepID=A0A1J5SLZ7_9ZZZZ